MQVEELRDLVVETLEDMKARDIKVIDVRGNGGGNVSQMLIERLRRELLQSAERVARERQRLEVPLQAIGHLPEIFGGTADQFVQTGCGPTEKTF